MKSSPNPYGKPDFRPYKSGAKCWDEGYRRALLDILNELSGIDWNDEYPDGSDARQLERDIEAKARELDPRNGITE